MLVSPLYSVSFPVPPAPGNTNAVAEAVAKASASGNANAAAKAVAQAVSSGGANAQAVAKAVAQAASSAPQVASRPHWLHLSCTCFTG
jgi:hypothetical protein